jgi:hypothetical protein
MRKHPINFRDLTGLVFGRLTAMKYRGYSSDGKYRSLWVCNCICGKEVIIEGASLVRGLSESCGCLRKELVKMQFRTHGFIAGTKLQKSFWNRWNTIRQRCDNPNSSGFRCYGAKGIKLCGRWHKFENFRDDMWESFLKHHKENNGDTSIERRDVKGNYELSNCYWATKAIQDKNKRITPKVIDYGEHIRLSTHIRKTLNELIHKENFKSKIFVEYFGLSVQEFRSYIESLWEPWMSWDNYGMYLRKGPRTWQIGHVIPVYMLDCSTAQGRKDCWIYTNLKPQDSHFNNTHREYVPEKAKKENI